MYSKIPKSWTGDKGNVPRLTELFLLNNKVKVFDVINERPNNKISRIYKKKRKFLSVAFNILIQYIAESSPFYNCFFVNHIINVI